MLNLRPAGPDSERDARREIYRDRERRRAARALDRWLEATYPLAGDGASAEAIAVAGERFVEAVGDYVLARIAGDEDALEGAARTLRASGAPDRRGWLVRALRDRANQKAPYPHPYIEGDDYLCVGCGALPSDVRHVEQDLHQKADYGVVGTRQDPRMHVAGCKGAFGLPCIPECAPDPCAGGRCPDPEAHAEGGHDV